MKDFEPKNRPESVKVVAQKLSNIFKKINDNRRLHLKSEDEPIIRGIAVLKKLASIKDENIGKLNGKNEANYN